MTIGTKKIPSGFKQTEIGVIPNDWEQNILGNLTAKIGSGKTPTGGEKVYQKDGRPLMRSQNVGWGELLLDNVAYISDSIHETFPSSEIEIDDVLLNITGASIGRCAIADKRIVGGNVNQHVCIIRTEKNKLNPRFLNFFLISTKGQKQIADFQAGGNRQGLNFGQISSFKISIPSTESEQTAIATALSDTDALIEKLTKLIEKKKNIKQGAMQELLTGKRRLPGFSGKWEEKLMEELEKTADIKLSRGKVISKKDIEKYPGNYPIYSSSIHNDGEFGRYGLYMFDEELITWSVDGGGNFFHRSKGRYSVTNVCGFMRINTHKLSYRFLAYQLQFLHSKLFFDYTLKAHPSVIRKAYSISLPKLEEQTVIATVLSDMDTEIERLESQLSKYQNLKQGMMQTLLTGKIRLI